MFRVLVPTWVYSSATGFQQQWGDTQVAFLKLLKMVG
jgi:hypothetical protein